MAMNKRIVLNLSEETNDAVECFAESIGKPPSSAIAQLLNEQRHTLLALGKAITAAKQGKEKNAVQSMLKISGEGVKELFDVIGKTLEGKKKSGPR